MPASRSHPFPFDLGILGGGQLARMTALAAHNLGLRVLCLDPDPQCCASFVTACMPGRLDDPEALSHLIQQSAYVTLENEFVPAHALAKALEATGKVPDIVTPRIESLALIQDKLLQRQAYAEAGVPSPKAVALDGDGSKAIATIGFPMVLKARFGGYDGRGTRFARTDEEFDLHRHLWEGSGMWLAEEFVPFKREVAVMVALSPYGDQIYPTVETVQKNYMCDVVATCDADASEVAHGAAMAVGDIGLFGVELFELEDGSFKVNEIAPRPHNSGHYTMNWGGSSQFEQLVRIATELTPATVGGTEAAMANLIGLANTGDFRNGLEAAMEAEPSVFVHWYGKTQSREGRKMGHINAAGPEAKERVIRAREAFYQGWKIGTQVPS